MVHVITNNTQESALNDYILYLNYESNDNIFPNIYVSITFQESLFKPK